MDLNINTKDFNKKEVISLKMNDSSSVKNQFQLDSSLFCNTENTLIQGKNINESIFSSKKSELGVTQSESSKIEKNKTEEKGASTQKRDLEAEEKKMSSKEAYKILKEAQAEKKKFGDSRLFSQEGFEKILDQSVAERVILNEKSSNGMSYKDALDIISAIEKKYKDYEEIEWKPWVSKDGYELGNFGTPKGFDLDRLKKLGIISPEDILQYKAAEFALEEIKNKYPDININDFVNVKIQS